MNLLGGDEAMAQSRNPEILADAAHTILDRGPECTGNFFIDEDVLAEEGITDLERYRADPEGGRTSLSTCSWTEKERHGGQTSKPGRGGR
jgi:hypothetical protein